LIWGNIHGISICGFGDGLKDERKFMLTRWPVIWICLAATLGSGCTTPREFPAPNLPRSARLIDEESVVTTLRSDLAAQPGGDKPPNVLVLSGGGMNGAFTVGLLQGWTESGARPKFDVVTGISAGALIAPFAFLGPEYDAALGRNASLQPSDLYHNRPLPALAWSDSLADSEPLWRLIETEITPDLLTKVARAHGEGRRLYVGTTNLDTKRSVVWDLGAIAAGNDPRKLDLFRKVLLASASMPGLLPPVAINVEIDGKPYTELHVDGGVSASLFLQPKMLGVGPAGPPPNTLGGNVYVIVAGKMFPDSFPVQRRLFQVSEESISGLLQAQFEGDILRVYMLTNYAGAHFSLAAVPQDFGAASNSMALDSALMHRLFDIGRQVGRAQGPWQTAPPTIDPRSHQAPRQGVKLITEIQEPSAPGEQTDPGSRIRAWLRLKTIEKYQSAPPYISGATPSEK
jgi:predicted acylesterase/phospholipase RssA